MEHRAPKYKRLCPDEGESCGLECRLKGAYLIKCAGFVKDENGEVTEVLATYDPASRGGDPADGRKVKGATMHWVDANNCAEAEVRLYSSLFSDPEPDAAGKDFIDCLNPESLEVLTGCKVERMLESAKPSSCARAISSATARTPRPDTWCSTAPSSSRAAISPDLSHEAEAIRSRRLCGPRVHRQPRRGLRDGGGAQRGRDAGRRAGKQPLRDRLCPEARPVLRATLVHPRRGDRPLRPRHPGHRLCDNELLRPRRPDSGF